MLPSIAAQMRLVAIERVVPRAYIQMPGIPNGKSFNNGIIIWVIGCKFEKIIEVLFEKHRMPAIK
ncbi:hypothetical protein [Hymenobacter armeniacus]|uniref:hypothetical protein n=1 Tax=Hymenobacter armeniacus TaxID=2771358 RepID=UPI001684A7F8|nr:hypothetical protein [Hymenobacter armeniacus]